MKVLGNPLATSHPAGMQMSNHHDFFNAAIDQSRHPSLVARATLWRRVRLWWRAIGNRRTSKVHSLALKLSAALLLAVAWHLIIQGIRNSNHLVIVDVQLDQTDSPMVQERKGGNLSKCELPRLDPSDPPAKDVGCKRIAPLPNSCKIAKKLFHSRPPRQCRGKGPYSICQMKSTSSQKYEVHCDSKVCSSGYSLGAIDTSLGVLKWDEYSTTADLQTNIQKLVDSVKIHPKDEFQHVFCFIRCLPPKEKSTEEKEERTKKVKQDSPEKRKKIIIDINNDFDSLEASQPKQLLILPLQIPKPNVVKSDQKPMISFNLYLLDSVSHSHFFRSLPKSVETLRQIKKSGTTSIFNFNLMQSLMGLTYVNLQALFSGELYYKVINPKAVQTWTLLKSLKEAGYRTSWTDDSCWISEWGFSRNMVAHSPKEDLSIRWKKIKDLLAKSGIDGIHFSLANCEILKANGLNHSFQVQPVCYNRQYHHHYTFQYLKTRQSKLNAASRPFFDFTSTDIAHERSGVRVQVMDGDLADYLQFLSTQDNMVTVILGDHGNTYGAFMRHSDEARIEMFHPVFLILISSNIAKELGPVRMSALSTNQNRLVSILDLHYTLRALSPGGRVSLAPEHAKYDLAPEGLLVPVSPNRTCDSIPRINPNICICSEYDKVVKNDTNRAEMARAALNKINEVILENAPNPGKEYGSCRRLELKWFGGVRESPPRDDVTVTKMDLHLDSGRNSGNPEEIVFVIMQSTSSPTVFQLVSFERLTSYSQFEKCKDPAVPIKLCVCDLPSSR